MFFRSLDFDIFYRYPLYTFNFYYRIGKRPGFAALGKKPKADPTKEKKTTPVHTGFLANDGNFLERFKQLQGAKGKVYYRFGYHKH